MRIKLHKRNVALLDFVKFTGYCSLIDNSSAEESVVRAELSVPMIVLSSSDGHNAVHTSVSYINIGKGRVENEPGKFLLGSVWHPWGEMSLWINWILRVPQMTLFAKNLRSL